MNEPLPKSSRRSGRSGPSQPDRATHYSQLTNLFAPQTVFSQDQVEAIHDTALKVLENLGMKILLPEAVTTLARAGAIVEPDGMTVRIGRDIVQAALATAPKSFTARAAVRHRDIPMALGNAAFLAGCGAPNVTDRINGRRAGSMSAYRQLTKLVQHFDVLHMQGPYVEPQDFDIHLRHYEIMRTQLTLSDKFPFIFARGTPQTEDGFAMIRLARGLDRQAFEAEPWCYTVINTNSPRQLDIPMAQGIIDFARAGQMQVITPFCLAGAMAPITVAGALTLQHAEALAAISLAQIVRAGAPCVYGSFASNVDMKSGAPAFGTPEHIKATLGSGQLARHLGLPWRSGGGTTANVADAQAAQETQFSLWGSMLAGATMCIHAAGWLEGGLSVSLEKFITDVEALEVLAEMCVPVAGDDAAIGYEAIADVAPGGHFFATDHTMQRYRTAFYEPIISERVNYGTWQDAGSKDATERATQIWKSIVDHAPPVAGSDDIEARIAPFIADRIRDGGALPVS